MTLTNKEKEELERLQQRLTEYMRTLPKPAKIQRINDAQGDRLTVTQNNRSVSISVIGFAQKSINMVR